MYYQGKANIIHGDCTKVIKEFPDGSFDAVITSPPYNMRTRIRNGQYTTREKTDHFSKKYSEFSDDLPINEYYELHKGLIKEMLRVANTVFINTQFVTGSKEAWFRLIGDYAIFIKDVFIWDKGGGQPAMHEGVANRGYELILILESNATAGRMFSNSTFSRGEMQDVWRLGRGGSGKVKGHSATFPESLVAKIINNFKCDTILDPFMGSGTTLVAASKLGKKATGIEISEKYCQIAAERLIAEELTLF